MEQYTFDIDNVCAEIIEETRESMIFAFLTNENGKKDSEIEALAEKLKVYTESFEIYHKPTALEKLFRCGTAADEEIVEYEASVLEDNAYSKDRSSRKVSRNQKKAHKGKNPKGRDLCCRHGREIWEPIPEKLRKERFEGTDVPEGFDPWYDPIMEYNRDRASYMLDLAKETRSDAVRLYKKAENAKREGNAFYAQSKTCEAIANRLLNLVSVVDN